MARGGFEPIGAPGRRIGPYLATGRLTGTRLLVGADGKGRSVVLRSADAPFGPAVHERLAALVSTRPAGLVPIVEAQLDQPRPFVATELVAGVDLPSAVAAAGPLSPVLVSGVATAVAEVLVVLHRAGRAHGGLTPADVLLTRQGPVVASLATDAGPGSPAADVRAWGEIVCQALGADAASAGSGLEVPVLDDAVAHAVRDALAPDAHGRPEAVDVLRVLLGGVVPPNPTPLVRSVLGRTWALPRSLVALAEPRHLPREAVMPDALASRRAWPARLLRRPGGRATGR